MSGPASIPLAGIALFANVGNARWWFGLLAFIALWIFAISIMRKNYQLRAPNSPVLEMEIVPPFGLDILTGKKTYRIRVKNTHRSKTVKNLRVWIYEIKWPESVEKPLIWTGIIFPYQLPPKDSQDRALPHELAANMDMDFDLLFVKTENLCQRVINLAPFHPKNADSASLFKTVVSEIAFGIEILPLDNPNLVFQFKIAGGDGDVDTITKSFILRVPPLLAKNNTENQVSNINSLALDFDKFLPVFEATPTVSQSPEVVALNEKINKLTNVRAQKAVEKLTELTTVIFQRFTIALATDPNKYDENKDEQMWNANEAAIVYITLNLNPEAVKAYDEGISEITLNAKRLPGVASTAREDEHKVVLAKFGQRLKNLKHISDNIHKYLKSI